jgi:predicted hydrocarbon binding protein
MVLSNILKKMLIGRAFTNERGRILLYGRMDWTLLPSTVAADLFQYIGEKEGAEYLYKLGYKQGAEVADEIIKCSGLKVKGGWIVMNAVKALLEFIGFGEPDFVKTDLEKSGHHHLFINILNNPVAEHAKRKFGSKSLVCNWFAGVYSAHLEKELGSKNTHFKEVKCYCKGAPFCVFETKW